jgi:N-acetylglucosaminyldiphosphoundecaprenol N-acetyl-beta-D-mannosaminyltransferase
VPSSASRRRVKLGQIWIDSLTFAGALDEIEALVARGQGGAVFTPNIDHVVMAESDEAFRLAYAGAELSLVDGKPLLWASRLLGWPLPEKISGADLVLPLMRRAAERKWRVYLLGGAPGVADSARELLRRDHGVDVAGADSPQVGARGTFEPQIVERVRAAAPHLLLVALGAPKQELFIHAAKAQLAPAVALGIGAGLDFIAGAVKRAPAWMSQAGLEWFYRLSREPRRLWRRYLVNDPKFLAVLARDLRVPKEARGRTSAPGPGA